MRIKALFIVSGFPTFLFWPAHLRKLTLLLPLLVKAAPYPGYGLVGRPKPGRQTRKQEVLEPRKNKNKKQERTYQRYE